MTSYPAQYDPVPILQSPDFKVIPNSAGVPTRDIRQNLACFYNQHKELHLVTKPMPKAGEGQVVVHVSQTG